MEEEDEDGGAREEMEGAGLEVDEAVENYGSEGLCFFRLGVCGGVNASCDEDESEAGVDGADGVEMVRDNGGGTTSSYNCSTQYWNFFSSALNCLFARAPS